MGAQTKELEEYYLYSYGLQTYQRHGQYCLVFSLSAAHARLHWDEIYIVAVMKYKSAQVLCRVCYDFQPYYLIW